MKTKKEEFPARSAYKRYAAQFKEQAILTWAANNKLFRKHHLVCSMGKKAIAIYALWVRQCRHGMEPQPQGRTL